jgi:hypothetical protein
MLKKRVYLYFLAKSSALAELNLWVYQYPVRCRCLEWGLLAIVLHSALTTGLRQGLD